MKWYEKPDVLDYIVKAYAGVDVVDGRRRRQFIWEEPNGDVVIGNARAFTDHVSAHFGLNLTITDWSAVHEALRAMGEVVHAYTARTTNHGGRFRNQQPHSHIIRRGSAKEEKE